jgi:hypothetical protein
VITFGAIRATAVDVNFTVVQYAIVAIVGDFIVVVEATCQEKRSGKNSQKEEYVGT